jgi:hypothetical protein
MHSFSKELCFNKCNNIHPPALIFKVIVVSYPVYYNGFVLAITWFITFIISDTNKKKIIAHTY